MRKIFVFSTLLCLSKLTVSHKDDRGRIVGGFYASSITNYSYVTYIKIACTDTVENKKYCASCGSSILNQWFLLTAGHCVENCAPIPTSNILASAGDIAKLKGQNYLVKRFLLHEHYDEISIINDITLMKLSKPMTFGSTVSRVSVVRNPPLHEAAVLAGWGLVSRTPINRTNTLKVLKNIEVISPKNCLKDLHYIPPNTFCAGFLADDVEYAAEGDSGSPLVVRGYIQIGLVSFMNPKYSVSLTVYTEVSKFYHWIEHNTKVLFCT